MTDETPQRLPEPPGMRRQVSRTFRLDGSDYRIYVTPTPDAIIAYLGDMDTRTHHPESAEVEGSADEWLVFEDVFNFEHRVRLFEEPDGTRVIAFHNVSDLLDGDDMSYEWNIDADYPSRSGWRPLRLVPSVDEWAPKIGKLTMVSEAVQDVASSASFYDAKAVAAATESWDLATEIGHVLIPWLHDLEDAINWKFTRKSEEDDQA